MLQSKYALHYVLRPTYELAAMTKVKCPSFTPTQEASIIYVPLYLIRPMLLKEMKTSLGHIP